MRCTGGTKGALGNGERPAGGQAPAFVRIQRHFAPLNILRTVSCLALLLSAPGCGRQDATGPRPLAARYILVSHGGRALPVLVGTEMRRPPGGAYSAEVTCERELVAGELRFWSEGSYSEVRWQDSTRITCSDGSPMERREVMLPGTTQARGEGFRVAFYHGRIDEIWTSVAFIVRKADTLTVVRREEWRNETRVALEEIPWVFVPAP